MANGNTHRYGTVRADPYVIADVHRLSLIPLAADGRIRPGKDVSG
jgi:hypothetical protein